MEFRYQALVFYSMLVIQPDISTTTKYILQNTKYILGILNQRFNAKYRGCREYLPLMRIAYFTLLGY